MFLIAIKVGQNQALFKTEYVVNFRSDIGKMSLEIIFLFTAEQ